MGKIIFLINLFIYFMGKIYIYFLKHFLHLLKTWTGAQIFKNSSIIKPVELELLTILSYHHLHGHH
jgi:hypothetical protein